MSQVFLHYEDPVFEEFGGLYVPYATQVEAERQAANDLRHVDNDVSAARILGMFEAEYGGHKKVATRAYAMDEPFGHLAKGERKKLLTPAAIAKLAPKHQADLYDELQRGHEAYLANLDEQVKRGGAFKASQPGSAWTFSSGGTATGGAIALAAATAKTVVGVAAGAADQPLIVKFMVSFDGVTASAVPVLVEPVTGTNATNPPGTNSTSMTPKQIRGWPGQTPQTTGAYAWSAEPTVLEAYHKFLLTPNGGAIWIDYPLGREPTGLVTAATQGKLFGIRLTAPAIVNAHVSLEIEE